MTNNFSMEQKLKVNLVLWQ